MDKLDHIYALHKILNKRKTPISQADLSQQLGCSRSTLTRLLKYCREALHAPIAYDRDKNGYYYVRQGNDNFELPGLWFNPDELVALMTCHRLLTAVQPGILEPYLAPFQQRIEQLLEHKRAGSKEIFKRIRILQMDNRVAHLEEFQKAADALVSRQQLRIQYSSRSQEELTERWVSPQRLIYYRDNWYLDAWCHLREGLRTFALDRMHVAEIKGPAKDIPDQQLDAHVIHSYGIFAGHGANEAVLHFSNEVSRWVADEQWHPAQQSRHIGNGRWELVVPYGDPTELIRDILKFGPEAEVISPPALREQVMEKLSQALRQYRKLKKV